MHSCALALSRNSYCINYINGTIILNLPQCFVRVVKWTTGHNTRYTINTMHDKHEAKPNIRLQKQRAGRLLALNDTPFSHLRSKCLCRVLLSCPLVIIQSAQHEVQILSGSCGRAKPPSHLSFSTSVNE